jgi:hypothetical protein
MSHNGLLDPWPPGGSLRPLRQLSIGAAVAGAYLLPGRLPALQRLHLTSAVDIFGVQQHVTVDVFLQGLDAVVGLQQLRSLSIDPSIQEGWEEAGMAAAHAALEQLAQGPASVTLSAGWWSQHGQSVGYGKLWHFYVQSSDQHLLADRFFHALVSLGFHLHRYNGGPTGQQPWPSSPALVENISGLWGIFMEKIMYTAL